MFKSIIASFILALSFSTVANADTFISMDNNSEYYEFNKFGLSYINFFSKAGQWEREDIYVKDNYIYANNGKRIYKIDVYDSDKIFINGVLYFKKQN